MVLNFTKSRASEAPVLLDTTSSKAVVYIRKNVQEIEITDEHGNTSTEYEYDECKLSKDEYKLYLESQEAADTSTGIQEAVAEVAEQMESYKAEGDETDVGLQLAVADLAEATESTTEKLELAIAELAELLPTE